MVSGPRPHSQRSDGTALTLLRYVFNLQWPVRSWDTIAASFLERGSYIFLAWVSGTAGSTALVSAAGSAVSICRAAVVLALTVMVSGSGESGRVSALAAELAASLRWMPECAGIQCIETSIPSFRKRDRGDEDVKDQKCRSEEI